MSRRKRMEVAGQEGLRSLFYSSSDKKNHKRWFLTMLPWFVLLCVGITSVFILFSPNLIERSFERRSRNVEETAAFSSPQVQSDQLRKVEETVQHLKCFSDSLIAYATKEKTSETAENYKYLATYKRSVIDSLLQNALDEYRESPGQAEDYQAFTKKVDDLMMRFERRAYENSITLPIGYRYQSN